MVNLRFVATKFPEISAYDVLGLLVYNCGIESVEAALNEIKSAQQSVQADAPKAGAKIKHQKDKAVKGRARR